MSKSRRGRHKAKRRRQKAVALLGQLAAVLNDCERAGVRLRDPKIAVLTDYGVVVRFKTGWAVRPFTQGSLSPNLSLVADDEDLG